MSDNEEGFAFKAKAPAGDAKLDLFNKRHEKTEEEDVEDLRAAEKEALAKTMSTVEDVPKGSMGGVEEKVEKEEKKELAHEPPANWKSDKFAMYPSPNPLLVDVFHQLRAHYFKQAEIDEKKKFAGQAMSKVIKNVGVWDADITSGKMAMKEIVGIGKGTAEIIDALLKDFCYTDKDGVTWYPEGNIDVATRRKLNEDGTVPPSPRRKPDEDPLAEARKGAPKPRKSKAGDDDAPKKKRAKKDDDDEGPKKKKGKKKVVLSEDDE